ncbi:MAG: TonB-dependent receptor [Sphingobium sp.]
MKYFSLGFRANASAFYYDYKNKQEQTFTGTGAIVQNTGAVRIYGVDVDAEVLLAERFTVRGGFSWIHAARYQKLRNASDQSLIQDVTGSQSNGVPGGYLPGYRYNVASCAGTTNPLCVAVPDNPATPWIEGATFNATGLRLIRAPRLTGSLTLSYDQTRTEGKGVDASATLFYSSEVWLDITGPITQPSYAAVNAQVGYRFNENVCLNILGRNINNKAYKASGPTSSAGFNETYAAPREIGVGLGYKF